MQAIILCGGRGLRLWPQTSTKPKPLVSVGGKPLVQWIIEHYAQHGFERVVLAVGYMANAFEEFLKIEGDVGVEVDLVDSGRHAGTAKRVTDAADTISDDVFHVTYGDGLANVDLDALSAFHAKGDELATITVVHPTSPFGEVVLTDRRVKTFVEKPPARAWINGGYMVLDRRALLEVERDDEEAMLVKTALPTLAERGQLAAFKHTGFWQCIDTSKDLQTVCNLFEGGRPW